jgi:hypothetical protein
MSKEWLAQAANIMYKLLIEPFPTLNELRKAARIGCETLRDLVEDQQFFTQVNFLRQLQTENLTDFHKITEALTIGHFRNFLSFEKELMRLGGLNPKLVEALISQAENLIEDIKYGAKSADELHGALFVLRQKTCSLEKELKENQQAEEQSDKRRARLLGIAYAVGGAALIGINASSAGIGVIGLSRAGKAFSGAVGGAIIDKAWGLTIN